MVSIRQIAQELGVSPSTVSLALRHDPRVNPATRCRIIEYSEAIGYVPSFRARSLSKGRSFTLQVLDTWSNHRNYDPFMSEFLAGALPVAEHAGYRLVISLRRTDESLDRWRSLRDGSADGFLLLNPQAGEQHAAFTEYGLPVVVVGRSPSPGLASVDTDNRQVGRHIGEHLHLCGFRQPVLLGPAEATFVQDRLRGLQDVLPATYRTCPGDPGEALKVSLQALETGADALVVTDDVMLPGVLKALRQYRKRMSGQRCGIVGMGNTLSPYLIPECTSVDFNAAELGRVATAALLALVGGQPPPATTLLVPHVLHPRQSTLGPWADP